MYGKKRSCTYLTIIISSIQIITYMMKQISQYFEKIVNVTPRTLLITGFLSGVGIDPEGIRLWAVKKMIEFLQIGENTGQLQMLNIALLLLELFYILVTVAQVIKTEPIGWICASLGFFSGFTSTNIYLGLSFLALGIFILRFSGNSRIER